MGCTQGKPVHGKKPIASPPTPVKGAAVVDAVVDAIVVPDVVARGDAKSRLFQVGEHLEVRFISRAQARGTWTLERRDSTPRRHGSFEAIAPLCAAVIAEARSELKMFTNVPVRNETGLHLVHLPLHVLGNVETDKVAYNKLFDVLRNVSLSID